VDKIVIMTNRPEPDPKLLELVNRLFPDCDIHIKYRGFDPCKQGLSSSPSETLKSDETRGDMIKDSNCR